MSGQKYELFLNNTIFSGKIKAEIMIFLQIGIRCGAIGPEPEGDSVWIAGRFRPDYYLAAAPLLVSKSRAAIQSLIFDCIYKLVVCWLSLQRYDKKA